MFEFILNGSKVTSEEDISLLTYLRDVKNLTSVKNGCNEGSCGACMILVDGKAMRSCLLTTRKIHGKKILTVEGFQQFEKEVYRYAFTKAGAVQCGFCTPGMLISAKGLLDNNLNPTTDEIRKAIRGNICRCTGYVKIIEAIKMAASLLKTGKLVVNETVEAKVGTKYPRIDATDKILGKAIYVDDLKVDNMLYGSALRSKYPRSIVKSIDTAMALEHPECVAIITAKDIPGKRYIGHLVQDWPALIDVGEETRYVGDAICLVAAKTKAALADIKALINVSYEELTPITTPERALAKNAPKIHPQGNVFKVEKLKRGNVDEAIKKAKYVVTHQYTTPFTEHAFLEPESSLGLYEDGIVTIYTGSQGVYDEQREIAELLGVPKSNVRTISKYVGGAFGGKEDMSVQHHAAVLAYLLKQPVKVTLSRKESIMVHPKRHAMEMTVTTACDEAGNLTAFKAKIISDTGAYGSLGGPVLQRACTHAAGPYRCKISQLKVLRYILIILPQVHLEALGLPNRFLHQKVI